MRRCMKNVNQTYHIAMTVPWYFCFSLCLCSGWLWYLLLQPWCLLWTGGSVARSSGAGEGNKLADYTVEYAKSNRSTCRGCDEKIAKVCEHLSKLSFALYDCDALMFMHIYIYMCTLIKMCTANEPLTPYQLFKENKLFSAILLELFINKDALS